VPVAVCSEMNGQRVSSVSMCTYCYFKLRTLKQSNLCHLALLSFNFSWNCKVPSLALTEINL
jgi:hypothetical protein